MGWGPGSGGAVGRSGQGTRARTDPRPVIGLSRLPRAGPGTAAPARVVAPRSATAAASCLEPPPPIPLGPTWMKFRSRASVPHSPPEESPLTPLHSPFRSGTRPSFALGSRDGKSLPLLWFPQTVSALLASQSSAPRAPAAEAAAGSRGPRARLPEFSLTKDREAGLLILLCLPP